MSADFLADISQSLGISKRIFEGGVTQTYAAAMAQSLDARDEKRRKQLREIIGKRIVEPVLEANFPEMYWELMFCISPRGRVMKRRDKPLIPKIEWK